MKCNASNKDIFERERAMQLWPYVEFNYIILCPKFTKLLCISFSFVLHVIYVAAMRCLKQDHNGHVIVSVMLLISSLLSFFESFMKQRIPKIMRISNIMIHWYSLHIIYTKIYMTKVTKNL